MCIQEPINGTYPYVASEAIYSWLPELACTSIVPTTLIFSPPPPSFLQLNTMFSSRMSAFCNVCQNATLNYPSESVKLSRTVHWHGLNPSKSLE